MLRADAVLQTQSRCTPTQQTARYNRTIDLPKTRPRDQSLETSFARSRCGRTWAAFKALDVVLLRPHRPQPLIVSGGKVAVVLSRIEVDERAHEHRMGGAAHVVLDGEEVFVAGEIDDVAEAVLIRIVFAVDQIALGERAMGS